MIVRWLVSYALLTLACSPLMAQTLVFPQIADGGGIRSELLLTNPTSQTDTGTIAFKATSGQALALSIGGVPRTEISYSIVPGGVFEVRTDGTGSVKAGYAIVSSNSQYSQLTGSLVYSLAGGEVSVPATSLDSAFHVFAKRDASSRTGIAIVNLAQVYGTVGGASS